MKLSYIKRILALSIGLFTLVMLVLVIIHYSKKTIPDDNSVALKKITDAEPSNAITPIAAANDDIADNTYLDSSDTYIDEDQLATAGLLTPTGYISIVERVKGLPEGDLIYGTKAQGLYPQNTNVMTELNGDGKMDSICYIADGTCGESVLLINNVNYSTVINEHYEISPDQSYYLIGDIDNTDSFIEIGLPAYGPSSDETTSFFQYDGNELIYLGCVPGLPIQFEDAVGYGCVKLVGDGNITTESYRLQVIQTWFSPVTYTLKTNTLTLVEQDIYYPYLYESEEFPIRLLYELPIYQNPFDETAKTTLMTPQAVKLTATDNKNWCKIEGADGTSGWFYFTSYDFIPSLQKNVSKVIENLCYAD